MNSNPREGLQLEVVPARSHPLDEHAGSGSCVCHPLSPEVELLGKTKGSYIVIGYSAFFCLDSPFSSCVFNLRALAFGLRGPAFRGPGGVGKALPGLGPEL